MNSFVYLHFFFQSVSKDFILNVGMQEKFIQSTEPFENECDASHTCITENAYKIQIFRSKKCPHYLIIEILKLNKKMFSIQMC